MSELYIYPAFVAHLAKQHPTDEQNFLHGAIGVSKEAGELLDNAYRYWNYNKPFDRDNVIEECGDILFYLQMHLNFIGSSIEEAISTNVEKLKKRYPEGYSNAAALARADKAQGQ